jgi:RES domain
VLETLARTAYRGVIHRLAGRRSAQRTAAKLGLVGEDLKDFVEALGEESLAKILLSDPFAEKTLLGMPPYGWPTRFSDGTFPVFYAAEARDTSEEEMAYHRERDAQGDAEKRLPLHMWAFHCDLNGSVVDLRPKNAEWEWLTSKETCHPNCLQLGREAVAAKDIDAFQAPSARQSGGTTVPTFNDQALSNPVIDGTTIFTFDVGTGKLSWHREA